MNKKEEQKGRRKISSNDRTQSFSSRALNGNLIVEKKACPYCGHKKSFLNQSQGVHFGEHKCCKCKRWF